MEIKYYDERYYLSWFGVRERKYLDSLRLCRKEIYEEEKKMYASLISAYDSYIELAGKLINEISLDNSISKGLVISDFIKGGLFLQGAFEYKKDSNILISRQGLNIINRQGCCRHVSNFMTDIFKANGEFCENLTVVQLDKRDKRKATREKANHMINLINYDNILYGFDATNNFGSLIHFINSFELLPIDSSKQVYMYYKPYFEYVDKDCTLEEIKNRLLLFKESGKNIITQSEFKDIVRATNVKLSKNLSIVGDFLIDTNKEITDIKEKVMAMKK